MGKKSQLFINVLKMSRYDVFSYNVLLDIKKNIIQKPRGSERNFRASASSSQNGRNKSTLISR